jgi:hypothetical protein
MLGVSPVGSAARLAASRALDEEFCWACGTRDRPLDRVLGAPFCLDCLEHATLDPRFALWDDLGGGD